MLTENFDVCCLNDYKIACFGFSLQSMLCTNVAVIEFETIGVSEVLHVG